MNKSETIGQLAAALSKAQARIQGADKNAKNPHFKSNYADIASVWNACRIALSENELAVSQMPSAQENVVTMDTILMHSSGEWVCGSLSVTVKDSTPQSIGSAITYLRRYGLSSIVGVAPSDEDDDGEAAQPARSQQRPVAVQNAPQPKPEAPDPITGDWVCGNTLKRSILDLETACENNGVAQKVLRDKLELSCQTRNPAYLTVEQAERYLVYLRTKSAA